MAIENAAIIVAAGSGTRAANPLSPDAKPKQFAPLAGETVLRRTLEAYSGHPEIGAVLTVLREDYEPDYRQSSAGLAKLTDPAQGGATRQQSVLNGLRALKPLAPARVLIHDAARPFIGADMISRTIAALDSYKGAIAAIPVADTLKRGADGTIAETVDRAGLWAAQTPQAFHFEPILAAHEAAAASGRTHFSDDASIAEWAGLKVALIEGSADNWKITTAEDLARAERQAREMKADEMRFETRAGTGFDVHSFEPGDHVTLCGVKIPHTQRLNGHSDADAPLHALTDALLGTIGAGDIGDHFPPSDMQWRGADSAIFLAHARSLIAARGGRIVNVDVTILAERPKIAPYREAMRLRIAQILGIAVDRVGLKATTMEGLGFIGRREGIAAMAAAAVALPAKE